MEQIATNRDLYLAATRLVGELAENAIPSLEVYLINLSHLSLPYSNLEAITPQVFYELLRAALSDSQKVDIPNAPEGSDSTYRNWLAIITKQIESLRKMNATGQLAEPHKEVGVDAPDGERWYNFDPETYLECGIIGAFGGWENGDDTERILVPGPCLAIDENGDWRSVDPTEIERPTNDISMLTWDELTAFLNCGRAYE